MTIIAWDTRTLAVDKQITCGDAKYPSSKCRQLEDGTVLAWAGCVDAGLILAKWYEDGADIDQFPFDVKDEALADLIVVTPNGRCLSYCQAPYPMEHTSFAAWGNSKCAALCCMELGAGAVKAVEVVSKYSDGCGFGVDWFKAESCRAKRICPCCEKITECVHNATGDYYTCPSCGGEFEHYPAKELNP